MHILVLSERYVPEITAPSFRVKDHAKAWLQQGHEVTVVTCAPNFPHGKVFEGYRNRPYQVDWVDGVRVVRVWSYMAENKGTLKRTLDYLSYMFATILFFWRYPKFDVLVATSPPLFVGVAGWVVARLRRRRWVFEVRDLWPASIKAVGASDSWLLTFFEKLELFLYRRADRIVVLTPAFRDDLISRGIDDGKIDVVTNGVDTDVFDTLNVQFDARERLGVEADDFLVGYLGTVGMAHGLETVLDAAELCQSESRIRFLIMGEGAERARLEEDARKRGLSNLIFHDFVPHDDIPSYLGALDLSLVHLKPHSLFKTVIPSKIFESMAMATPLLHAVEGVSAEIVEETGSGVCIPSGNPQAIVDAVLELRKDKGRLAVMGAKGQDAVARRYGRRVKAAEMVGSFNRACGASVLEDSEGTIAAIPPQEQPSLRDSTLFLTEDKGQGGRTGEKSDGGERIQVVIFGGSGFIGTRLAQRLLDAGYSVRIADLVQSAKYPHLWVKCDVENLDETVEACGGMDIIFNLAAEHRDDVSPIERYYRVNVDGARNVCRAAEEVGIDQIIFTSSVAVYGLPESELDETATPQPFNDYGRSKLQAEAVYESWAEVTERRALIIVRPTVVFGERNRGNFYNLAKQIASGRFVMVGDGGNQKSIAYVENVAAFLEYVTRFDSGVHLFNYVDKPDQETRHLVHTIYDQLGKTEAGRIRLPYWMGYGIGTACDVLAWMLRRKLSVSAVRVRKFCANTLFSAQRALDAGFEPPVDLDTAVRQTIQFEFGQFVPETVSPAVGTVQPTSVESSDGAEAVRTN